MAQNNASGDICCIFQHTHTRTQTHTF